MDLSNTSVRQLLLHANEFSNNTVSKSLNNKLFQAYASSVDLFVKNGF